MESESIIKPPKSERLKAGRVTLKKGENIGKHKTSAKEELIIVLKGTASIQEEKQATTVRAGQTHYIQKEQEHDVRNEEDETLEYIYVVSLL